VRFFGRKAEQPAKVAKKPAVDLIPANAPKRDAFRSPIELPVTYTRIDRQGSRRVAVMRDLSAGGMRLMTMRAMDPGTELELRFTLPSSFLDAFSTKMSVTEVSPFGARVKKTEKTVRPFAEITLRGTVMRAFLDGTKVAHGVKFLDITEGQKEEIERFNHYWQLWQRRKIADADP
jgi:c-di-GMP-binding flagellar brake protein YcgR